MNTSPQSFSLRGIRAARVHGLTLIELLVCIAVATILILLVIPTSHGPHLRGRMADQLNNGRQIYLSLRNYASESHHAGAFPTYADPKERTGLFEDSNAVFQFLLPRYLDDKRPMQNKNSAWCRATTKSEATATMVRPGENDWCYMRGLTEKTNARWPLLANAFAAGTTHYVKDQAKPGGVWKGVNAIVVYAGGSAEIAETKESGESFFIKRSDKPSANAFESDGEWLAGENVKLLYPADPNSYPPRP